PMVETEEFLVACTKAAVFRMRISTGRWEVIIRPEQHPSARIKGISAGKDAVFFAGEHRENKTLRPLLWKTDLADWQLHRFPVEEALRKSGLKQFNNLSNVIPVDNKLLLAIHRGGYSGIAAELNPDNNTIKAVAIPPAGDVALGFDPSLVKKGTSVVLYGKVRGVNALLQYEAADRRWKVRNRFPGMKGWWGSLSSPHFWRGHWWGLSHNGSFALTAARGLQAREIPFPLPKMVLRGIGNPLYLNDRYVMLWAEWPTANGGPVVYDAEQERWIVSRPFDVRRSATISPDRLYAGKDFLWIAENYTLHKAPRDDILKLLGDENPQQALHDYFARPWKKLTIEQAELGRLGRIQKMSSRGVAIVEAEEAKLHDSRGGRVLAQVPSGTCVLTSKWFNGHGQLVGPGVTWESHNGNDRDRFAEWEPVILTTGQRGWMRGRALIPCHVSHVSAQVIGDNVTVYLTPDRDSPHSLTVDKPEWSSVIEIVEIEPKDGTGPRQLWVKLERVRKGNPPVTGWVPSEHVGLGFVQIQRHAVWHWSGLHGSLSWHGKVNDRSRATRLLDWMAKTYGATRFRHPGIFDGGGPAICHAGYQARLDQAALFRYRWKEPKKALAIYEDLMKADPVARTYQGTVPAWAANERAGLLREMKRYQSALEAYRQVVSKHGKHYWQRGMYVSASEAALYRMKQICLEDLKSPALWKSETAELKKLIKDPKLSKRLNQLSDRNGGP
ncbi:MAG: hypothetical protein QF473_29335, partial [Planctomycetota bacterium]|nr:hypothetical protein [Planctomycetota bacterium]